jgi:CHAT domain-containing protein
VADGSAAALCSVFHRQLAVGHGSADALHRAARAVAGSAPDRRHFYHWGAFIAVGRLEVAEDAPTHGVRPTIGIDLFMITG